MYEKIENLSKHRKLIKKYKIYQKIENSSNNRKLILIYRKFIKISKIYQTNLNLSRILISVPEPNL